MLEAVLAFAEWLWGVFFSRPSPFKLGQTIQKQQDQIAKDANQLGAVEDVRAIEQADAALSDADVDKQLRAESAERAPKP